MKMPADRIMMCIGCGSNNEASAEISSMPPKAMLPLRLAASTAWPVKTEAMYRANDANPKMAAMALPAAIVAKAVAAHMHKSA